MWPANSAKPIIAPGEQRERKSVRYEDRSKKTGDGVSVDQIVSAQTSLILYMSGFLTNQRLWGATTFIDHVSDYVYVHLMRDLSLPETLLAKSAMKKVMAQAGRTIKH